MEITQEKPKPTLERLNQTLLTSVNELELLTEQINKKLCLIEPAHSSSLAEGVKEKAKSINDEGTIVNTFKTSLERLARVRENLEVSLTHLNQIV